MDRCLAEMHQTTSTSDRLCVRGCGVALPITTILLLLSTTGGFVNDTAPMHGAMKRSRPMMSDICSWLPSPVRRRCGFSAPLGKFDVCGSPSALHPTMLDWICPIIVQSQVPQSGICFCDVFILRGGERIDRMNIASLLAP